MKMSKSQKNAMLAFHKKAEKAFLKYGKKNQAEMAKKQAKKLKQG